MYVQQLLNCFITTFIDQLTEILVTSVIYVIQSSLSVLQMLVQELQDLFTLVETILIMMQQIVSRYYCNKGYSSLRQFSQH